MAKICYMTGEPVLYIDCIECENKAKCRRVKELKIMVSVPRICSDKNEILSELDLFFEKNKVKEIVAESEMKDSFLENYAVKKNIVFNGFSVENKNDDFFSYFTRIKKMIQYSDVVFIFDGGTSYTGYILKEAKRQHKQGKIIRIKPIITIPELSDAFVYAATMLYPREELIKIYKWLLLYLNKRNFFVPPILDMNITDQMFEAAESIRLESKSLQTAFAKDLNVSRIFHPQKQKEPL